jgi:hypothetical protein
MAATDDFHFFNELDRQNKAGGYCGGAVCYRLPLDAILRIAPVKTSLGSVAGTFIAVMSGDGVKHIEVSQKPLEVFKALGIPVPPQFVTQFDPNATANGGPANIYTQAAKGVVNGGGTPTPPTP